MSTREDLLDCEDRNDQGYPKPRGPMTRPRATVHAPITGDINQNTDNSVNKALPWVAIACLLAGLSLGVSLMQGPIADAKLGKAKAELRQEFNKDLEELRADMGVAKYEASLAKTIAQRLDEKDKLRAKP